MKLFIVMLTFLYVSIIFPQPQATDSIACASVSTGDYTRIVAYFDTSHAYINAGYAEIIYSKSIIKRDSDYVHHILSNEGTISISSPYSTYIPSDIRVENIQVVYEENALHVTWEMPDTSYADKFHIFYAEAQIGNKNMLDSALYWGMTYEDCWDWEIGVNMYDYFFVIPKKVFPAYTSLIRIGVMAEFEAWDEFPAYSKLFLAPDIVNKTPQELVSVTLKEVPTIPLVMTAATASSFYSSTYTPSKVIDSDTSSYWRGDVLPQWARVELNRNAFIKEVKIMFRNWWNRTIRYNVDVSIDGIVWTQVIISATASRLINYTINTFTPTEAKYVRITVISNTGSNRAEVKEIQVKE